MNKYATIMASRITGDAVARVGNVKTYRDEKARHINSGEYSYGGLVRLAHEYLTGRALSSELDHLMELAPKQDECSAGEEMETSPADTKTFFVDKRTGLMFEKHILG